MKLPTLTRAGNALIWQAVQHFGVKFIFLIRLTILARLLSPDDFGLLAIASVALDVMMRVTDFGMVEALVQRLDVDERHYHVAWTVGLVRAIAVSSTVFLVAPFVAQLFAEPRATNLIRLLAIRPLIEAGASIKIAELTRNLRFRSLALIELPKALANTLIAIMLAQQVGVWSLVVGALAGSGVYLILSYFQAPYVPRLATDSSAVTSLIRFGRWIFLISLVVMLGQSTLRLLISRQLGAVELGLYYLAVSLAFLPVEFISQVAGNVIFPYYSRLQTDIREASIAFRSILTSLLLFLLPVSAFMIVLAPSLVENMLGSRWEGAAPIIQVLTLAGIVDLVGEMIIPILKGIGRPDKVLVMELFQSAFLIGFVWVFASRYGIVGASLAWLPALIISKGIGVIYLRQILHKPFEGMGLKIGAITIVSISVAAIMLSLLHRIPGLAGLLFASTIGFILTSVLFWCIERRFRLGLIGGITNLFPGAARLVGLSSGGFLGS